MEKTGKVLGKIFEFIGTLFGGVLAVGVEYLLGAFEAIVDVVSGIVSIVKGLFTGDMQMVGEGLKDVFKGVIGWFYRLPMALYDGFIDMFPKLGEMISSFFSSAWSKVTGLFGFGESDSGKVQKEASGGMTDGGSVNDGVIQNGKIVSTHPEDTIMAMKSPSDILGKAMSMSPLAMLANGIGNLIGGAGSGGSVDMGPLIAEIKGLRADLAAGKISINMDGRKVTSGITKIAGQSSANSYVQR
jgi:phage-related protein